ncbi:glycoside hydrolase family 2 protein [Curtobacterium flaccumfaciens]|uniref:glycoside hydrolase family 2 protein n=1 Tax=Curtobacterium flaccumfaciens TaxID=2035 RepID=UPI001366F818|nr:glycoside hydrolase family 2 protein [Curtobacterium flaccumfaciens]MBT1667392.1 glycoside hydrolase family 2 protein [Curtobacterium flaccumfaciens pv. flaccumfaciens]QHN63588.1 glycoside hydrolase family 2 protein [Curtobacterium flaccumfaciens pv. flaccumfaciens]
MERTILDGTWTLEAVTGPEQSAEHREPVEAQVPGCVHTDLLRAGRIPDPFDGDGEAATQWIGDTVWRYRRTFEWTAPDETRHDLVAEGLDSLATIELNGIVVATTANQHRSYRFPVGHLLRPGTNELVVTFDAPVPAAERLSALHGGELPHVNHHPYNALRKNASNFGWDWGVDVATSGIWKSIGIESWSGVRIAAVRPLVDLDGTTGVLTANVDVEHAGSTGSFSQAIGSAPVASADGSASTGLEARITLAPHPASAGHTGSDTGGRVVGARPVVDGAATVRLEVPDVAVWWPRGEGDQPLYDVRVEVGDDVWTGRVGFRTVTLDTAADAGGAPFLLRVNGRPVMVRGANWIPDHAYLTEMTPERYADRIQDAIDANMNLLRIWGGGIYESDDLYDRCDELGVLVWQDFLFACAAYAEEPWLADEVEPEVREAVTRLSPHPSLVVWNGNNENLVAYAEWGWRPSLVGRTWGNGYYRSLLPAVVAELDPTRPYTPGSPFSFDEYLTPNDQRNGSVHIWDVWNRLDYRAYADWEPRFVAEFGFQGPPAWSTLTAVVHDEPLDPDGHEMLVHQKADQGNRKLADGMRGHLPEPTSIEDWHFAAQLNQAHAIRFGLEWFRSRTPDNTGTVVWQLNDDWPVVSWALVDHAGIRKPVWYAVRQAYQPVLLTVQPSSGGRAGDGDGGLDVVLVNASGASVADEVTVSRVAFDGTVLESSSFMLAAVTADADRVQLPSSLAVPGDAGSEVLVVTGAGTRTVHDFAEVVDQALEPSPLSTVVSAREDGATVTVTATAYARDVSLFPDRVDAAARVDDGLVSLLPGESVTFTVTSAPGIAAQELVHPLVLRHAGSLLP